MTNAALAFGTPALLLNCISNDWQLWSGDTEFILKRVFDKRNRRFLTLSETYRRPTQAYLVNKILLERRGYHAVETPVMRSPRLSLQARQRVRKRAAIMRRRQDHRLYHQAIADNPYIFGAGRPVVPFLQRHPELVRAAPLPNHAA